MIGSLGHRKLCALQRLAPGSFLVVQRSSPPSHYLCRESRNPILQEPSPVRNTENEKQFVGSDRTKARGEQGISLWWDVNYRSPDHTCVLPCIVGQRARADASARL